MSEIEERFHEVMAKMGDTDSSWRVIFQGAVTRLNEAAHQLVARPPKGSQMADYVERQNPTMRAKLIATWKPWRVGGVTAQEDKVHGTIITGDGDIQVMAKDRREAEEQVKQAVIAEMVANPKAWVTASIMKGEHGNRTH